MTITHTERDCLDCGQRTWVASNEPKENQRCIGCYREYIRRQK